jgi:hypothetical protein
MTLRPSRPRWTGCLLALAASLLLGACGGDVSVALPIGGATASAEYVIGNTAAPGSLGFSAHSLGGQPFSVATQTNLLRLGVHTFGGTAKIQMAVYTDGGSAPNTLVIASASTTMVDGAQEVNVTPTVLLPGSYWILFVMDAVTNIGNAGSSNPYRYLNHAYGSALPNPIFGSLVGPPHDLSIWMVVQD